MRSSLTSKVLEKEKLTLKRAFIELTAELIIDVEPSSILENRFPKELPLGYASQTSQPPTKEDSTVTAGVTAGVSGTYYALRLHFALYCILSVFCSV
jgi:hypothetical protein